ncbi:MAG: site-specific DNA-methyltransferase [Alphaproteobacteria bacterium]|nr:site-specific DNA-methyltransferase [Alphaproteobacteria bacterium]
MPSLDWIGKRAVINHHREVPYRLLKCDKDTSFGDPESGNLLVQGDNLEALKALLPFYAGKVTCISIDPSFNTCNESWIYNDNVNSPEIKVWLRKVVGKEAEDLSRHDKWLCMMYPRLRLLKEFLREDGSIWISIDDNEAHGLKLFCDEIFGRINFVASIIWQKKHTRSNDAKYFSDNHDFIICYSRS